MTEGLSARRTVTRNRLADAAVAIFAERGVLGASLDELCEAANFTRGAFYSNFSNRNELCVAIIERRMDAHDELNRTLAAAPGYTLPRPPFDIDTLTKSGAREFISVQGLDRTSILAAIELRLHAVRDASFRAEYLTLSAQSSAPFLVIVGQGANDLGYRLSVTKAQAITIMEGTFEMGALADMLHDADTHSEARIGVLAGVLRSLLVLI